MVQCCAVEVPHLTLCCICCPSICSYCSSTCHCLPHESRVGPRRPCSPRMIEPRCFNVVIWGRIAAVSHIGHKVIMLGIVAPAPLPAVWRENDRMEPIPSHSTRPTVAWMIRVLIVLVVQLEPAVQFALADGTVDPQLPRFTPPICVGHRPVPPSLRALALSSSRGRSQLSGRLVT